MLVGTETNFAGLDTVDTVDLDTDCIVDQGTAQSFRDIVTPGLDIAIPDRGIVILDQDIVIEQIVVEDVEIGFAVV